MRPSREEKQNGGKPAPKKAPDLCGGCGFDITGIAVNKAGWCRTCWKWATPHAAR